MAVSKAHINATNKYNKKNYRKLQANIKPNDYNLIDSYCKRAGIIKYSYYLQKMN